MTACPPTNRYSTPCALNNSQRSVQSRSIRVMVPHPEGVQLGADAQPRLGSQPAVLLPLDSLGIGMVGEQPDVAPPVRFVSISKTLVRRGHRPRGEHESVR